MNEREIFLSAVEFHDPAARQIFLNEACGGNAALRGQVERLLKSHEGAGEFLRTPAVAQIVAEATPGDDVTGFLGLASRRPEAWKKSTIHVQSSFSPGRCGSSMFRNT